MIWLIYYLIVINLFSFLIFGFDKFKAKWRGRRIPENFLFLTTFFGGSLGSLVGMYIFRHKTSKASFQLVIAFLIFIQLGILALLLRSEILSW